MDNRELAMAIRHKLFADRETLTEAFDYAFSVFRSLGPNEMAATTAMMVVLNTVAKELIKGEKE
jgi:hypothetical protein